MAEELGDLAAVSWEQLECLDNDNLCLLLSFLDFVGGASLEELVRDFDVQEEDIRKAIGQLVSMGCVIERSYGKYIVSDLGRDILSVANLSGASVGVAEFARAYVVRAKISLDCAVLQVNKFLVAPLPWLPGLELETGYPFPLEKRLEQCYPSRAPSSVRDYSEGLRPISLSWALALLGACGERVQSLMIRESYARRTYLRKGSSSVGAYERLGRKMQLMADQVSLPVLRCLTSPKMRFVHVLSVSKLVSWYWSNKGFASQRSGEYHLAIKYYRKALMYNPGSVDIWYNLGYSYLENKQYVTAIECFRTVARLDVDHEYDVLFCIARCAA